MDFPCELLMVPLYKIKYVGVVIVRENSAIFRNAVFILLGCLVSCNEFTVERVIRNDFFFFFLISSLESRFSKIL